MAVRRPAPRQQRGHPAKQRANADSAAKRLYHRPSEKQHTQRQRQSKCFAASHAVRLLLQATPAEVPMALYTLDCSKLLNPTAPSALMHPHTDTKRLDAKSTGVAIWPSGTPTQRAFSADAVDAQDSPSASASRFMLSQAAPHTAKQREWPGDSVTNDDVSGRCGQAESIFGGKEAGKACGGGKRVCKHAVVGATRSDGEKATPSRTELATSRNTYRAPPRRA